MRSLFVCAAVAAVSALVVAICLAAPGYYSYLLGTMAVTAIVGAGLNVLLGLSGEVSLGQAGFMALGAYGVAILTTKAGFGFWEALPLAVLLTGLIAAALSLPALRLTGPYLAMVTIAFGFIVESVSIEWRDLTGGSSGLAGIPAPFGTGGTALLACAFCALTLAGFHWFLRRPLGMAMQAVASAPFAARSIGINPLPVRTIAFVLAAALAGLAGGLQAALTGFIAPSSFPFSQSILFLLVTVVGGAGRSLGPLIGAVIVVLMPEVLAGLAEYRLLFFGAGLLIVLWIAPGGLAGVLANLVKRASPPGPAVTGIDRALAHIRRRDSDLKVDGLRVAFGGVVAVAGVDLTARGGRITSVIGPNGAGKTTLLNLVSGFQASDAGSVRVGQRETTNAAAHIVARNGLARTFQTAQPFANLTVLDNVRLGLLRGTWRGKADADLARSLLALVGYSGRDDRLSGTLSHVDRRLLEIARALGTGPGVLLLDEPAAGLDDADSHKLGQLLQRLASSGLAIVLVEHDMSLVMSISDDIVVLDAGRRIAAGTPSAVRADPAVKAAYLGGASIPRSPRVGQAGPTLLDVAALSAGYGSLPVLDLIDLTVAHGETVAILGPNGAGKSTLMKSLSGLLRPVSGSIRFDGEAFDRLPAHLVARAGLILVPEGRQVFPHLTVLENLRLGAIRRGGPDPGEVDGMLARFPALRRRSEVAAGLLSGGEQQMLAVARGLLAKPKILLLDEPSLGLAPAIAIEMFAALRRLRDEGMTLLIADQMADHVLTIADRGYMIERGRIALQGDAVELQAEMHDGGYLGAEQATVN